MALDAATAQQLIQKLTADREAYLESVNKITELLLQAISASGGVPYVQPRLTADTLRRNHVAPVDVESVQKTTSAYSGEEYDGSDSESDTGVSHYASEPLSKDEYDIEGLRKHIKEYEWTKAGKEVLNGVWNNEALLQRPGLFPSVIEEVEDRSHLTHFAIHDVADDGSFSLPFTGGRKTSRSAELWEHIRSINGDPDEPKLAVGRLAIVREPSPLLFAALHYTHHKYFDMDEIFHFLVDDDPALLRPHKAFAEDERHRRTMIWNAEYFTIVGENCEPMKWQRSSEADTDKTDIDHIPISRCSSIIGIAFEGPKSGNVKSKDRRLAHAKNQYGHIYSPFSPWRVLHIQCHPDWHSTIHDEDDYQKHKLVNGPEAFLTLLRQELADAGKRLLKVHRRVEDLCEPPSDFIFSSATRDRLLFEDHSYTLSRRYFWASQTLTIMNKDIEEMIESYEETFNENFWQGKDKVIWPTSQDAESSARNVNWRKRMGLMRRGIDDEIRVLRQIEAMNDKEIEKIRSLREELFSGTSVQESRKSVELAAVTVEQGRNIRILTIVTIFFTPCMFVTGIFGMTNMPPTDNFDHFAWSLIAICLPTYLLLIHINTDRGLAWWTAATSASWHRLCVGVAKATESLLRRRTSWTASYLAPEVIIDNRAPPGRQRHNRTLSTTSMEMALRTRAAPSTAAVQSPSMSRTVTTESRQLRPESPRSPPSPGVTFHLDHIMSVGSPGGTPSSRRKDMTAAVEDVVDGRDLESPFPTTPNRSFLDRLRPRPRRTGHLDSRSVEMS